MRPATQGEFLERLQAHGRMLGQVACSYARSDADRADLGQEIVAQLWRAFPRYDPARPFSTWMYRIALNVAISFARRQRELAPLEEAGAVRAPEGQGEREGQLRMLEQFVSGLPPLERALVLLYLDERSQREIAEVLGISESNVSTRIHRIKGRLRERAGARERGESG
ncbi:MAG TPA: sigma-70 family RNA polymerase sigma factor [Myxococcaceae bacterium]|nr:sigma-70 family RNA polymerase sigma factor [Myxococcaceae bacterium]